MLTRLIVIVVCLSATNLCIADTLIVDDDGFAQFNTIQDAVDAASDGDLILVYPGTYTNSDDSNFRSGGTGGCPAFEIADCNGNCCPESWVGDGYCDDGTWEHNGIPIFLNCDKFNCDEGDCECGDDPTGACCVENMGFVYCVEVTQFSCNNLDGAYWGNKTNCNNVSCGSGPVVNTLGKAITLRAIEGPSVTIMDALQSNHVILCDSFEGADTIIDGFTITGGNATNGGGLNCNGSSPTIINCIFDSNSAEFGGGVRCYSGSPTITNCTFTENTASWSGGAIYCWQYSSPTITNCIFTANTATKWGGAIEITWYSDGAVIEDCIFTANAANEVGGAIDTTSSTVDIRNSTFIGNITNNRGSAIFHSGGSEISTISNCTISGNSSSNNGGAVYLGYDITMDNCEISSNQGGGIYINTDTQNPNPPFLSNSVICGNDAFQINNNNWVEGSNVCLAYSCDDNDQDGMPDKCQAVDEDILYVPSQYSTIQAAIDAADTGDTVLVSPGNWTGVGDAVINPMGKSISIESSHGPEVTIIDGLDSMCGIICNSGETNDTIIEGFTITRGYKYGGGGGIFCGSSPPSSPSIIDCIITECSAEIVGGGILITGWVDPLPPTYSPRIIDCVISSNLAQAGGGIACLGGSPEITNCQILDNSAESSNPAEQSGGGVLVGMRSAAIFTDCTISENSSAQIGGGIAVNEWGNPSFFNCTIQNNSAVISGGGIYANSWKNINLNNCTLSNNVSPPFFTDTDLNLRCPNFSVDSMCSSSTVIAAGTTSVILKPGTIWGVDGEFTTSLDGNLTFVLEGVLDIPNTKVPLSVSDELLQQGCLAIHTDTGSLVGVEEGDVITLAEVGSLSGNFESVVFPIMPEGLGLQLVEQSSIRGGESVLSVEVIAVENVNFADPLAENLDSPPTDIVDFDANGDGRDEVAILFSGTPGGVVAYNMSDEGSPSPIDGLNAYVGNNPVTIDSGDMDGDGLDDLLIINETDNTLTLLFTQEDSENNLSFTSVTITIPGGNQSTACGAIIDWNGNSSLDAVVGIDHYDPNINDSYQVLLDLSSTTPSAGPTFDVPSYVQGQVFLPDPVTAVDSNGNRGFVGGTRYGRVHHATQMDNALYCIGVLNGTNIVTVEAIDLDDGGGDGLEDVMVSSDEAQSIYLFEGDELETDGFGDMIPIEVSEEMTDLIAFDADSDGDMDLIMAVPTSINPVILLRNDGAIQSLAGSLGGRTWSKQATSSTTEVTRLASGGLSGKDDEDDWVGGGGNSSGAFFGDPGGTFEQTNIVFGSACPSDLNRDGIVGVEDLLLLIAAWGSCNGCPEDLNSDTVVGVKDLLIVIAAWGSCT